MPVSAVVVNFNARELMLRCVTSLERALEGVESETEIVVVDNGSSDGGPAALRESHPDVRVLDLGGNRGYPAAANAGIRASSAEWVLLLNNDTTVEPDAVSELLAAAEGDPSIGSLAAQMRFERGGAINSAGFGVDRLGVAFDRHVGSPVTRSESAPTPVFGACAGAALMSRAMLEDVGLFDESFFMYLEDVDIAWRAQMRGWRCIYVPAAVVHHHHSATSQLGSPRRHFHVGRNRVRLLAKHAPPAHLLRYGPAMLAYDFAYVLYAAFEDRTLTPLSGRVRGLCEWRAYRALGANRRPVELAPVRGLRHALRRRASVSASSSRDVSPRLVKTFPPTAVRRLVRSLMLAVQPLLRYTRITVVVGRTLERLKTMALDRADPAVGPDGLPVPPARLRVGVVYSPDLDMFMSQGERTAAAIADAAERHGLPMSDVGRLLDFGCGCGRVTRHWSRRPGLEVHGCDVNQQAVDWVRSNLPFVRAYRNDLEPPLPHPAETFGLVHAISVFTHLPEDVGDAWMRELYRITRPGGFVLFSVNTRDVAQFMTARERQRFDSGRVVVQFEEAAGENICNAYHPESSIEALARGFERVELLPPAADAYLPQDLWVLRRPENDGRLR